MKLSVNGEARDLKVRTLEELARELGLDGKPFAIERNREVVPRSKFRETALRDGDRLEIVHFVGGG